MKNPADESTGLRVSRQQILVPGSLRPARRHKQVVDNAFSNALAKALSHFPDFSGSAGLVGPYGSAKLRRKILNRERHAVGGGHLS